jgi:hypothetical protein
MKASLVLIHYPLKETLTIGNLPISILDMFMLCKKSNIKNSTNPIKNSQISSFQSQNPSLSKNLPWKNKNKPHQDLFGI